MNPFALSGLLTGITSFAFGYFVFLKGQTQRLNRLWFIFTGSVAVWGLGVMWFALAKSEAEALWAWRVATAFGVLWIPILFHHFVHEFCEHREKKSLVLSYILGIFFLPFVFTDQFFSGVRFAFSSFYYSLPGPLFTPFTLWWFGTVFYSHFELYKAHRRMPAQKRHQIEYFFLATAVGFSGGSLCFLPIYGIELYPYGQFAAVLYPIIMTYAIVKYRLMDITVAMEKGLTYLLLLIILLVPSYAVLVMAEESYFGTISYPFSFVVSLLFALMLIGAYMFKGEAQAAIAKMFFRERYDTYETLSKFSKALATILDLKTLVEEIERTLVNVLGVETATLYLFDKERRVYRSVTTHGTSPKTGDTTRLTADDKLPRYLAASQTILVREEVEHFSRTKEMHALIDALWRVKADVCIPFVNKNALVGFCVLGPRRAIQMYSDQDVSLLTMLAQAAAIALDNAVLYEELKRSQSLVRRTDRLRSLETIAGGFAHEVRNPLTSIKTFIQLTPERKDDPEFIGHFSSVVAEDVARIERLIQEILDYARYMQPKFQEEDTNVIVESCLYFIRIKADSKAVLVKTDLASDLPPVLLDRQQIKQVLLNLFINAIEAMNDHGGQLIVRTHRLSKAPGDTWAQIEVTDTGCGIHEADLEHIFDPFYTTKHESQDREGTGLGLTIAHQIVQEHGGHIEVKSELGRGTTFLVNLPAVPARVLEAPIATRSA